MEYRNQIEVILRHSNLSEISGKAVRKQLEMSTGQNLSNRREEMDKVIIEVYTQLKNEADAMAKAHAQSYMTPQQYMQHQQQYMVAPPVPMHPHVHPHAHPHAHAPAPVAAPAPAAATPTKRKSAAADPAKKAGKEGVKTPRGKKAAAAAAAAGGLPEAKTKSKRKSKAEKSPNDRRGLNSGLSKPALLSPALAAFMGAPEAPRTLVVKELWKYIKARDLQDQSDRRFFFLDENLKRLFDADRLNGFSMNKLLSQHVTLIPTPGSVPKPKKVKKEEEDVGGEPGEEKPKRKTGLSKIFQLEKPLQDFVGATEMSRPQVTKFFWAYIKERGLQDPQDGRFILCDDRLKALLGEDRIQGFAIQKFLSKFYIKSPEEAA